MPEDSKKYQDKRKNDPKEQRKPRNSRSQVGKQEKKAERVEGESKSAPKVTFPQKPPVYEDPGPEFYKNLKRETEEILKLTEEENSKYKKKEIQSNWSKYEMPIESYEEIEEHDFGADYEKLIQAPLSIGGHFQFKHEKSWDVNTGPSLYDKYFEISMDNLSLAVSTIPFYERNEIDQSLFSKTDMLNMNNRATRYKQKYYNDKSYATPETEAQDRILNSLKESLINSKVDENFKTERDENLETEKDEILENNYEDRSVEKDINLDFKSLTKTDNVSSPVKNIKPIEDKVIVDKSLEKEASSVDNSNTDVDDLTLENVPINKKSIKVNTAKNHSQNIIIDTTISVASQSLEVTKITSDLPINVAAVSKSTKIKPKDIPVETKKNPVIESPEDLEKWLDDFLDG